MAIPVTTSSLGPTVNPSGNPVTSPLQYPRKFGLLVTNNATGQALDLSDLRVKFSVKKTISQTTNIAIIRVYNVAAATAQQILGLQNKAQTSQSVTMQAGYPSNTKTIFSGNVRQIILGRENATDTFVEMIAADGDRAYNFAFVNTNIKSAPTNNINSDIDACAAVMTPLGVSTGGNSTVAYTQKRPRGKSLFGHARNYLRNVGFTTGYNWSIEDEKIVFVPVSGYLPSQVLVINQNNGMIGTPLQTLMGVDVKILLNPNIRLSTRVQLNNQTIQALQVNLAAGTTSPLPTSSQAAAAAASSIPLPLPTDGIFFVASCEHTGDTRGQEWYSNLITWRTTPGTLPDQSVGVGG